MLDTLKTTLKLKNPGLLCERAYVDGAWVEAADGGTFPVTNPADGSLVAKVPQLGVDETRAAIEAAAAAWPAWRSKTAKERSASQPDSTSSQPSSLQLNVSLRGIILRP